MKKILSYIKTIFNPPIFGDVIEEKAMSAYEEYVIMYAKVACFKGTRNSCYEWKKQRDIALADGMPIIDMTIPDLWKIVQAVSEEQSSQGAV